MAVVNGQNVVSDMHYLEPNDVYEREKPYSLRFPPSGIPNLPQSNVRRERHRVQFRSMRDTSNLRLDTCGFELLWSPCPISYEDFDDQQKIQDTYLVDLSNHLKRTLGAKFVIPLDFCVRPYDVFIPAPH